MNDLRVFFNTEIFTVKPNPSSPLMITEKPGCLEQIGNFGLTPCRYLFNGKKISIYHQEKPDVVGRDSFEEKSMLKTIAAILLLIPGLFFAIAKAFAYFSPETRKNHAEAVSFLDRELTWTDEDVLLDDQEDSGDVPIQEDSGDVPVAEFSAFLRDLRDLEPF